LEQLEQRNLEQLEQRNLEQLEQRNLEQLTMNSRNIFRQGDTMIAVESRPATVAFQDILDATTVVPDFYSISEPVGYQMRVGDSRRHV